MSERDELEPAPPAPILKMPTPPERLHLWQIQAVRDVLWIGALIVLVWAGYAMRAVTVPLLVALLLAYLFEPLVARLSRHPKLNRPLVVGGLVCGVVLTVLIALAIAVPLIVGQTVRLANDLRGGRLQQSILQLREYVPEEFRGDFDQAVRFFSAAPQAESDVVAQRTEAGEEEATADDLPPQPVVADAALQEMVRAEVTRQLQTTTVATEAETSTGRIASWVEIAKRGLDAVLQFLGTVVQIGFLAFLIPFYFFFFSLWYPKVIEFGRSMIPRANRERTLDLLGKMDRAVAGFVRGRIVISLLMGVMFAIGWSICGVPYAIVVGMVVGIFSAVPYLGGVGIPLAVGLLLIDQLRLPADDRMSLLMVVAGPTIVFVMVQIIESYLLTPVIAGKATNLDPVTILVAVLAGGTVGGVYGMLLAIPAAACAKILITDVLWPKVSAWLRGEAADPLPIAQR